MRILGASVLAALTLTVAATAALVAAPASAAPFTDTPGVQPALMSDCGFGPLATEPRRVTFFCGDGNGYVTDIVWGLWSANRAVGLGTQRLNRCLPHCYNGTWSSTPAVIQLEQPVPVPNTSALRFSRATIVTVGGTQSYGV
jgi:hypothetical protein